MNELTLLPNPDNVPGAVSSGYQRQNTNFFASTVGLDLLSFVKNSTNNTLTLYGGGIVEINGALYKIQSNVTFNLDTSKNQYVRLLPSGDYASASLVDALGTFDYNKNGYYSGGARIINPYDNLHGVIPYRIGGNLVVNIFGNTSTTYNADAGWYHYGIMGGKGGKGGTGGTNSLAHGAAGADGALSNNLVGIFRLDRKCVLTVVSGGNGGDGGDGTDGTSNAGGNGGNGGMGDISSIKAENVVIITAPGGMGGQGGIGGSGSSTSSIHTEAATGTTGTTGTVGESVYGGNVTIWKIA
jgi:hypothetical protein